jgi:hypothetical protein
MAETILRTTPDPVDAVAALLHTGVDNAWRSSAMCSACTERTG